MSDNTSLDDLLNDDEPTTDELNQTAEPEAEGEPQAPADRSDEAASAPEPTEEPVTGENDDPPPGSDEGEKMVPLAALNAARNEKREADQARRDLEAELAAFRQSQNRQQAPQPAQDEAPDAWSDPDAAIKHHVSIAEQQARNDRAAMSEVFARTQFSDYDEVIAGLGEAAKANPALQQQIWASPAPALAAYNAAKAHKAMAEIGDPTTYKERLRQEILAEVQAAGGQSEERKAPRLPQSMAAGANVGKRSGPAWGGPKPLADMLNE